MIDQTTGAPATEDTITIKGVEYTMRVGTVAAYELSLMNIDASEIFTVSERDRRVTSFAHIMRLFRALIAHNFVASKRPIPTPEELALLLEGEKPEVLNQVSQKTLELLFPKLMALTQAMKLKEPAPSQEPGPVLN